MRLGALVVAIVAGACGGSTEAKVCPPPPNANAGSSLLADSTLALPAWDSGLVVEACRAEAPWGSSSWGVEAASFLDEAERETADRAIDRARVSVAGGAVRVEAGDVRGRWAFARLIQGDVWGGTSCGPVPWNRIDPIAVARGGLVLDFDVCLEGSTLGSVVGSWILAGANVWLSAPTLPSAGRDRNGRKPLVMDLMVHHRTSMIGVNDGSHENGIAYHHQASVGEALPGQWSHISADLAREVNAAATRFSLGSSASDLAIHQVELVVEVHDAAATLWFSGPRLRRVGTPQQQR